MSLLFGAEDKCRVNLCCLLDITVMAALDIADRDSL